MSKTRAEEPRTHVTGYCGVSGKHELCKGTWPYDPAYPKVPTSCDCECHLSVTWTVKYMAEGLELEESGWLCEEDAEHFKRYLDDMGLGVRIEIEKVVEARA